MSYDFRLKDPVTGDTLDLPSAHLMTGGTYQADYDPVTGQFTPKPIREAWLNVTFNYSSYYAESIDIERGIKILDGMPALDSISILEKAIAVLKEKYQKPDGSWISTQRPRTVYYDPYGVEIQFSEIFDAISHGRFIDYTKKEVMETVNEGDDSNYWNATAVLAIKPLHQLIVMAKLRPDGIWECSY